MNKQNAAHSEYRNSFFFTRTAMLILSFLLFVPGIIQASLDKEMVPEEIPLTIIMGKGGTFEIPSVIMGTTAYLSIHDLFSFLKIKNTFNQDNALVEGYFLDLNDDYVIDYRGQKISYKGNDYRVGKKDLVQTSTGLYIGLPLLRDIFGLDCVFQFRTLSIHLKASDHVPLFRELKQEEKRKFLYRMKTKVVADTILERTRPFMSLGAADWAIYSTQTLNRALTYRANLSLGGFFAGGETTLRLNHYTNQPFTNRNFYYRWRHVNNQSPLLKQLTVGKIAVPSISSIFSPVIGVQVSNSPTTYRRFFAMHTITDHTEPGWTVELYVNNTLVDYTKADASGFFKFDIPLSYGNTEVKLRHYGPWGEERNDIRNIQIPYSFLPINEMEYQISAGIIENTPGHRFFRSSFNYGLTNRMTIGGGYEYLDAIEGSFSIPFLNTSLSLTDQILFTGEYAHRVKTTGMISFRLPSNLMLDVSYTDYVKGQQAVYYNYLQERKARFSIPVRFKKWAAYSRLSYNQLIFPNSRELTKLDHVLTTSYKRLSANLHTYAYLRNNHSATVYSELSSRFRISQRITFTPTIRCQYNQRQITGWRLRAEKSFSRKGKLTVSYEEYPELNIRNFQVGLRYLFSGVQTSAYANVGNRSSSFTQTASGGILFDRSTSHAKASSANKVGRGGVTVLSFLDLNSNGTREENEPKVTGVKVRATPGGQMKVDQQDTLVRIVDLAPYSDLLLEVNGDDLPNIAWKLQQKSFRVPIEPNIMTLVEVPVSVLAEISGSVRADDCNSKQLSALKINILQKNHSLKRSVFPDHTGYYSYLGLQPGTYTIQIDSTQLAKHQLVSHPTCREVHIRPEYDGLIIDEMNFSLHTGLPDTPEVNPIEASLSTQTEEIATDTVPQTISESVLMPADGSNIAPIWFSIQVFVANRSFDTTSAAFKGERNIYELKLDHQYKYYSGKYQNFDVAWAEMHRLRKKFYGAFIVAFQNGKPLTIDKIILKSSESRRMKIYEEKDETQPSRRTIWYTVQVAAMTTRIQIPSLFKGETDIQEYKIGKYYKYFIGRYSSYDQALNARERLRKKFPKAFIISFDEQNRPN